MAFPEVELLILSLGGIVTIIGFLYKVYANDLKHIQETLKRIEAKLDRHISNHAKGDFDA